MSLETVFVYPDWKRRTRQFQDVGQAQWLIALATVLAALLVSFLTREVNLPPVPRWLLATGLISILYLIGSTWVIVPLMKKRAGWLVAHYTIALAAVLAAAPLAATSVPGLHLPLVALTGVGLTLPMLRIAQWVFIYQRVGLLPHLWAPGSRGRDACRGAGVGLLISLLWILSHRYSGFPLAPRALDGSRLVFFFTYAVVLRPISEELFFRGFLLRHLHYGWKMRFGAVVGLTLCLAVPVYLMQYYLLPQPADLTLFLLAPFLLTVANSILYVWNGNLLAPIISHGIFRAATLLVGW